MDSGPDSDFISRRGESRADGMIWHNSIKLAKAGLRWLALLVAIHTDAADLAPTALAARTDGSMLYIACSSAKQVVEFDPTRLQAARRFPVPGSPSGVALSRDGTRLAVTCAGPSSRVCLLDAATGDLRQTLAAGHTALSPVFSADGATLFVCNRFNDAVAVFDLKSDVQTASIPVAREPVSAALTPDGRFLLVANHLPRGRADVANMAATVSLIDVGRRAVTREFTLPNGSINLRQIAISPDGRYACLAHSVARFQIPVIQIDRGWVVLNTLTLLDLGTRRTLNTIPLDEPDLGAANPWAVAWSLDGARLYATHAGTHELSVIDFPGVLAKLASLPPSTAAETQNDLQFLSSLRRRVQLGINGPRAMVVAGDRVFVAGYFSDSLDRVEVRPGAIAAQTIALNPGAEPSTPRRGEQYFNDATLCFQGWQSCASCHDDDARVDAVNWDLLNDVIGNPKNTKSLVLSHQTPPVMSLGIRASAEIGVRAGIRNSLAAAQPESVPAAMDQWLKSLKPQPSPFLTNGQLSAAARRGQKLFESTSTGCAICHPAGLFTDLGLHDVGTQNEYDKEAREFDTPTLYELWRTAPYLHDGSAATLREVLTTRNPKDEHGTTSNLTSTQIDDLTEYLLSL